MTLARTLVRWMPPLLIGVAILVAWVAWIGPASLGSALARTSPVAVLEMLALWAGWFALRFVRSQHLLRNVGIRLPIRPTLRAYLAALPGTMTPAYLGESIRSLFLRRRFGAPVPLTLLALLVERLHDLLAIALLAIACSGLAEGAIGWAFLGVAVLGWLLVRGLARRISGRVPTVTMIASMRITLPTLALTLSAWSVAGALYWVASRSVGTPLDAFEAVGTLARSTLWGALSLLPGGLGTTGTAAILDLRGRLPLADAVAVVTVVRFVSVGTTLVVGMVFLALELQRGTEVVGLDDAHFDTIAAEYAAQWTPHVWDLLLQRKVGMLADAVGPPATAGLGVDLGCGLGLQTEEMRRRGYQVIGLEPAVGLLRRRRDPTSPVIAGDALRLPFADGSVDFVYAIGVLHHLPSREHQAAARREIARVLRPGGLLLVHESNPRNPLFRFYMTYAFPMLKKIDEGTEWWIHPDTWEGLEGSEGLRLRGTRYFTFLPDFIPRGLMRPALAVEGWLERGPTRPYSAHYLAILQREGPPGAG